MDVSLPNGSKPSKVVSKDGVRPILTYAYVEKGNLWATDSYCLVRLPVKLKDGLIPRTVLEAAEKQHARFTDQGPEAVRVTLKDGTVVEGVAKSPGEPPEFKKLLSDAKPKGEVVSFAINAKLLANVAAGLGTDNVRITLPKDELDGNRYAKPIHVEPMQGSKGGEGLLMPIRQYVD